ncbi:MAG: NAD(P)H-dependent oxidoreductase subunit E [Chitinivibrionales bacterium]|nr:NAD(P)H-dependent oxidoreductase subunit E [Chitinivibrionales bacterium]MBD3356566.1 NAD(P)H-dependent oxidoreductase subunit E [Chitinivibrionales bacterium]
MAEASAKKVELSQELLEFIDQWKEKPGSLIMVLHRVQEEYGYVPRGAAFEVARTLEVPLAKVYGVITFYHLFKLKRPGKHRISVCMGTACYLKGGEDIIRELENLLGVGINAVTDDGEFSIEAVRCVGCCGLAPVVTIDGEVFGNLTKDKLPEIIATFRNRTETGL